MKAGIGSYAFRWAIGTPDWRPKTPMDAFSFIETSADLDADTVQICDNLSLDSCTKDELNKLQKLAADRNIEIEIGFAGLNPESLKSNLNICKLLHSQILRVVVNREPKALSLGDLKVLLEANVPLLEADGVTLCIENHFTYTPLELRKIVDELNHPNIAICYDPLNSISHFSGVWETLDALMPKIRTAHIKNAGIERLGTGFRINGTSLEEGNLNIPSIVNSLKSLSPQPNIYIETWMDRLEDEPSTLERELEWNCASINYLKPLL